MDKNFKSRIPVPIYKIQKFSKLCSAEERLEANSCLPKKQTSYTNKTIKPHVVQKNTERNLGVKFHKTNLKGSNKTADFKNKSASIKTSLKCDKNVSNSKTLVKSIKSNDKNKLVACKTNVKLNSVNKSITKTLNRSTNTSNKKAVLSAEAKVKLVSVEDKEDNGPLASPISCSFEPEAFTPQKNQMVSKQDCFSENKDVEFEANEIYRKMILSNVELTPNVHKLMPGLRLSSLQSERPSIYQKVTISKDPLRDALKALENACLSAKRIKKEDNLPPSPRRETFRDSIYSYSPIKCNPNEEFLRQLENLKLKQLQKTAPKSNKKVTFNLNIQGCISKNTPDVQHNLQRNSEYRLMQINENSKENISNYPHTEKDDQIKLNNIYLKHEHDSISNRTSKDDKQENPSKNYNKESTPEYKEIMVADQSDAASQSHQRTIEPTTPQKSDIRETTLQILKEISCKNSLDFVCDIKNNENYGNYLETDTILPLKQKNIKQSAKVYTPKPISLFTKSKLNQSFSPEFLVNGKSTLVTDLAPICTPLVLKSQARNVMLSPEVNEGPIKLKLDFMEEEKDTPKKESSKTHTVFSLDNIITIQKQSEQLADQECYLSLINEKFPVICGRYLTNPVAKTLNEGDDMHFIPI